jgi:hypothetical protein
MSHLVWHVGRFSEFERSDDPRPGDGQAMPDAVRRLRRGFVPTRRKPMRSIKAMLGAFSGKMRETNFENPALVAATISAVTAMRPAPLLSGIAQDRQHRRPASHGRYCHAGEADFNARWAVERLEAMKVSLRMLSISGYQPLDARTAAGRLMLAVIGAVGQIAVSPAPAITPRCSTQQHGRNRNASR